MIAWTDITIDHVQTLAIFVGGGWAYFRWRGDQRWKRRTAVRDRLREFRETPGAFNAQLMLGGHPVRVPLLDRSVSENPYLTVTPDEVTAALAPPDLTNLHDKHDAIRNSFNDLLGRLNEIHLDVKAKLIEKEDIRGISRYYRMVIARLIKRAPDTARALWLHMEGNEYRGVIELLELHKESDEERLEEAIKRIPGPPAPSMLKGGDSLESVGPCSGPLRLEGGNEKSGGADDNPPASVR